jgi:hypothetical protein
MKRHERSPNVRIEIERAMASTDQTSERHPFVRTDRFCRYYRIKI